MLFKGSHKPLGQMRPSFCAHCSDEQTKAQRGEVACVQTHSWSQSQNSNQDFCLQISHSEVYISEPSSCATSSEKPSWMASAHSFIPSFIRQCGARPSSALRGPSSALRGPWPSEQDRHPTQPNKCRDKAKEAQGVWEPKREGKLTAWGQGMLPGGGGDGAGASKTQPEM